MFILAGCIALAVVVGLGAWRLRHFSEWNIPACNDDFIFF